MLRLFLSFFGIGRYCDLLDAWERQLPPKKASKNSMKAILEKNFRNK